MRKDIHKLWQEITEHPDYRFGVIFTNQDLQVSFPESTKSLLEQPLDYEIREDLEDVLVVAGIDAAWEMLQS